VRVPAAAEANIAPLRRITPAHCRDRSAGITCARNDEVVRRGNDAMKCRFMHSTVLASLAVFVLVSVGGCSLGSVPRDLAVRIASARTPADHKAIARVLSARATQYSADAMYHRNLAARYETLAGPGAQYRSYDRSDLRMAEHCRKVADDLERAAAELTQLAHEHEQLAHGAQDEWR
jgi:hypothetical protein